MLRLRHEQISWGAEGGGELKRNARLTNRQRQIVRRLAAGLSDKKIADELGISVHTVRAHITFAKLKLGAVNRLHLVKLAG